MPPSRCCTVLTLLSTPTTPGATTALSIGASRAQAVISAGEGHDDREAGEGRTPAERRAGGLGRFQGAVGGVREAHGTGLSRRDPVTSAGGAAGAGMPATSLRSNEPRPSVRVLSARRLQRVVWLD